MLTIVHQSNVVISLSPTLSAQVDRILDIVQGQISADDQVVLAGILATMKNETDRLSSLDSMTPPKGA